MRRLFESKEDFVFAAKIKHPGDEYDYSESEFFTDSKTKTKIFHKVCGQYFWQSINCHTVRGNKCGHCNPTKKSNTIEFIKKCHDRHLHLKFNLSKVNYTNSITKICIGCLVCFQDFWMAPINFLAGQGCSHCDITKKTDTKGYIEKCIKKGLDKKYDLSLIRYVTNKIKIDIKCLGCSRIFSPIPTNFLRGKGCPECGGLFVDTEIFLKKMKKKYTDDLYDFSESIYVNWYEPVKVFCNKHLDWFMKPPYLLYSGTACPKCTYGRTFVSKKEMSWLDIQNISMVDRQKTITIDGKKHRVDACVGNTIYEFYGDYWHGNLSIYLPDEINKVKKKTMKELFDRTLSREKTLKSLGYDIIYIWESDYDAGLDRSTHHPIPLRLAS